MKRPTSINEGVEVRQVPKRPGVRVGKPNRVVVSAMRSKVASCGFGISYGSGGSGAYPMAGTTLGGGGNFYSPQLSTDFLELPQSRDERNNVYRFFYETDPFVGQAIDVHTKIPLSKIRLGMPIAKDMDLARQAKRFCEKWAERIDLVEKLQYILHDYNLYGEAFIWVEDNSPDLPDDVRYEVQEVEDEEGGVKQVAVEREDADERHAAWNRKNYKGWTNIQTLPGGQVHLETFSFTPEMIAEFIPDAKTKDIIERARSGEDPVAEQVYQSMPQDLVDAIENGGNIPLNMDPAAGSFLYCMANKSSQWEDRGHSRLQRCIRTLTHRDKLRQAQASIASRHMTPIRVVSVEDGDEADVEELREQVDLALIDPDYSIISNFEINWEEMGSNDRLLDLSNEYDMTDRMLYAGLGVTESLLSGESTYSGDRINLEVINTMYTFLRERLQTLVEKYFFRPMCERMGFIEEDEDGDERVLYPTLSFTRLGLRDNQDTFDAMFNLYQKGSLDTDTIYEMLNLDGEVIRERLQRDLWRLNDSTFNELLRSLYSRVADTLAEQSNAINIIADNLGLTLKPPEEEGRGRY